MDRPRIHLIAPAGSCRDFLSHAELASARDLIELVAQSVGPRYRVTGDERLIEAEEDESSVGRTDDERRADDITSALADDGVAAIVTIRGGAWLTRILPRIDFAVLDARTRPVAVFGFSEITSLVNIVGAHRWGRGVYDNAPAFLWYGLRHYAQMQAKRGLLEGQPPRVWARSRLIPEFQAFFGDVVSIIEGRGTSRELTARLVRGELPPSSEASFVGGNLTLITTMTGSRYQRFVPAAGHWIAIEDYREKPSRIDRMLAQLTLADYWEQCAGLLIGDFHLDMEDMSGAVTSLLDYHFPSSRSIPVLVTRQFGHIWPMHPVPLHTPGTINRIEADRYTITWPAAALATV